MSEYTFNNFYIPEYMHDGLTMYINDGVPPGGFLEAVISNNLSEACGRADDTNIRNLPAYCAYLYNEAPVGCWGSKDAMLKWIEKGGLNGHNHRT